MDPGRTQIYRKIRWEWSFLQIKSIFVGTVPIIEADVSALYQKNLLTMKSLKSFSRSMKSSGPEHHICRRWEHQIVCTTQQHCHQKWKFRVRVSSLSRYRTFRMINPNNYSSCLCPLCIRRRAPISSQGFYLWGGLSLFFSAVNFDCTEINWTSDKPAALPQDVMKSLCGWRAAMSSLTFCLCGQDHWARRLQSARCDGHRCCHSYRIQRRGEQLHLSPRWNHRWSPAGQPDTQGDLLHGDATTC